MVNEIYRLCNRKGYFTCGSAEQYKKMFELVNECAPIHDVALIIWICSDDKDLEVIERELESLVEAK